MHGFIGSAFVVIVVFAICLTGVYLSMQYASGSLYNAFNSIPMMQNSTALAASQQVAGNLKIFDQAIPMLIVGILIVDLILAAFLNANPLVWGLGVIVMIILTYVSFYVANALHILVSQPVFATIVIHDPTLLAFGANLPTYCLLFTGIYLVVILLRVGNVGGLNDNLNRIALPLQAFQPGGE